LVVCDARWKPRSTWEASTTTLTTTSLATLHHRFGGLVGFHQLAGSQVT
jgi:hypothetical protein